MFLLFSVLYIASKIYQNKTHFKIKCSHFHRFKTICICSWKCFLIVRHPDFFSDSCASEFGSPSSSCIKNKHSDEEEQQEVKRLKFSEDCGEEEEEDEAEEEAHIGTVRPEDASDMPGSSDSPSSMTEEKDDEHEESEASTSTEACEDQGTASFFIVCLFIEHIL